ncbi:Tim44/TimA family putative adaptor protein [Swingsia samuiensis]|uniref:Tim44 domain-containing protein n=1 Tax=Swingsia samuiensis TaxID=1293412 RepID=A0A4Y6UIX5_9PROT|nr:Tim44/TimA family putative adaptor protein [Swingsia samuiensis]QDH17579.1 Tim44 domain-containing protein [Swingsia samuiensis]
MPADGNHPVNNMIHNVPWDIVVLAILAIALAFRLYQVLGRKVGMQGVRQQRPLKENLGNPISSRTAPPPLPNTQQDSASEVFEQAQYEIPSAATRVGAVMVEFGQRTSTAFLPDAFLKNVEVAFRQVIPAFASGDLDVLGKFLTSDTEQAFKLAIEKRREAGEKQQSEIKKIDSLAILDASLRQDEQAGWIGQIEVRITSHQINLLTTVDDVPVQGTDAVTEFHDLWLFERKFDSSDSSWRLAASRPA